MKGYPPAPPHVIIIGLSLIPIGIMYVTMVFFFFPALPLASRGCEEVVRPDFAIKEWGRCHLPCWAQSSGRIEWDWCDLMEIGLHQKSCLASLYHRFLAGMPPTRFPKFQVNPKGPAKCLVTAHAPRFTRQRSRPCSLSFSSLYSYLFPSSELFFTGL